MWRIVAADAALDGPRLTRLYVGSLSAAKQDTSNAAADEYERLR